MAEMHDLLWQHYGKQTSSKNTASLCCRK